ncbi:hypothetical protein J1614_004494 [Plenodomus biglobosus]|nr:hypothetical protein J1614_004494 [Plenodomus biglobosus]
MSFTMSSPHRSGLVHRQQRGLERQPEEFYHALMLDEVDCSFRSSDERYRPMIGPIPKRSSPTTSSMRNAFDDRILSLRLVQMVYELETFPHPDARCHWRPSSAHHQTSLLPANHQTAIYSLNDAWLRSPSRQEVYQRGSSQVVVESSPRPSMPHNVGPSVLAAHDGNHHPSRLSPEHRSAPRYSPVVVHQTGYSASASGDFILFPDVTPTSPGDRQASALPHHPRTEQSLKIRHPQPSASPPAPRLRRLSSPEFSNLEEAAFCNCSVCHTVGDICKQ